MDIHERNYDKTNRQDSRRVEIDSDADSVVVTWRDKSDPPDYSLSR